MFFEDNYQYKYVEIDQELLAQIRGKVKEGDEILKKAGWSSAIEEYARWITVFSYYIDIIDPLGEDFSGDSLSARWYHAQWYNGDRPTNKAQWKVVFSQYLGVASTLEYGKVKVVDKKIDIWASRRESECIFHRRDLAPQNNLVMGVMPLNEEWADNVWQKQIKTIIEGMFKPHFICRRAEGIFVPGMMQDLYESILTARIIIADVTGRDPEVFYLLGLANALGKDTIVLTQESGHIPADLQKFKSCLYSNDEQGYEILREYLPAAIMHVIRNDRAI